MDECETIQLVFLLIRKENFDFSCDLLTKWSYCYDLWFHVYLLFAFLENVSLAFVSSNVSINFYVNKEDQIYSYYNTKNHGDQKYFRCFDVHCSETSF